MSQPAIRVENLSKQYMIGASEDDYKTFREALSDLVTAPVRRMRTLRGAPTEATTHWALKDVNFEVQAGEAIGIIGRNGAGKSTLLKILSRITEPTTGRVRIGGRVASLLEVGTGFHPELSGRENVYLNGAILGMSRREIESKFDEIVAFSEIEKFIDTPVKRYSSGMQMRLAFAVAAHLESEILIVDEVLAVGDAKFQSRCLDRMKNIAQTGRTVLFVSHSLDAISALTQTGLLLVRGAVAFQGRTTETIDRYLHPDVDAASNLDFFREVRATPEVAIQRIEVNRQEAPTTLKLDGEMDLEITVSSTISHPKPCVTLIFSDQLGRNIATLCSLDKPQSFELKAGQSTISVRVPQVCFSPGRYTLDIALNAYLTAPAWDLIRGYPLGEVIVGEEFDDTTLVYPHRTWGAMHVENVMWSATGVGCSVLGVAKERSEHPTPNTQHLTPVALVGTAAG